MAQSLPQNNNSVKRCFMISKENVKFCEYYYYCVGAGASLRKERAAANQQPLSSSLREQVCVHVVRARPQQCNIRLPNIAVCLPGACLHFEI